MKKLCKVLICSLLIVIFTIQFAYCRSNVIGYTTYDWQYSGPVYSNCRYAPVANGIHCSWMYANTPPSGGAPDRNLYYNFYDFTTRTWGWSSGTPVFVQRSGFSGMDYDPITGNAVFATSQYISGVTRLIIARDQAPGAGIFETGQGPSGYRYPAVGVTNNQAIHIAMIDITAECNLWYDRSQSYNIWSTPVLIQPSIKFPSHNISASKISNKVIIFWVDMTDSAFHNAYYKLSNDGGITWQPTVQLPFPPAFSGITGISPSFNLASLFACFDNNDDFHIVASVNAVYNDSFASDTPAEIWHYCPVNNPQWTFIFRYNPYYLPTNFYIGYNAIIAERPSIIQDPTTSNLYVTWEVFNSLNFEPLTCLSRADIYIAELVNNGQNLNRIEKITSTNTTSKRFPCIGGVKNDTIFVQYLIDSIAGFEIMTQGPATRNPVVCEFFPRYLGIEETSTNKTFHNLDLLSVIPNPFTSHTTIRFGLSANNNITLEIFDVTGRLVKTFNAVSGGRSAVSEFIWNGKDNNDIIVKSGVYFYTLKTTEKSITQKVVKTK
jgi:hypothetical protein